MKSSRWIMTVLLAWAAGSPAEARDGGWVTGCAERGVQTRIFSADGRAAQSSRIRLAPGRHRLAVACVKVEPWGERIVDTVILLSVRPGCDYELQARFDGDCPLIAVKEKRTQ